MMRNIRLKRKERKKLSARQDINMLKQGLSVKLKKKRSCNVCKCGRSTDKGSSLGSLYDLFPRSARTVASIDHVDFYAIDPS